MKYSCNDLKFQSMMTGHFKLPQEILSTLKFVIKFSLLPKRLSSQKTDFFFF